MLCVDPLAYSVMLQYTTNFKRHDKDIGQKVHYTGNNLKAMHVSVEASLKKLRTDYIDILYVHWVSRHYSHAFLHHHQ